MRGLKGEMRAVRAEHGVGCQGDVEIDVTVGCTTLPFSTLATQAQFLILSHPWRNGDRAFIDRGPVWGLHLVGSVRCPTNVGLSNA